MPQNLTSNPLNPLPDKSYIVPSTDTKTNLRDSVVRMLLKAQSLGLGLRWYTLTVEYLSKNALKIIEKNIKIFREIILQDLNKITEYYQVTIGIQTRFSYSKELPCYDFNILVFSNVDISRLQNNISRRLEKRFKSIKITLKTDNPYFKETYNTLEDINRLGHYTFNQTTQKNPYKTVKFTRYAQSQKLRAWNERIESIYPANASIFTVRDSFKADGWTVGDKNNKQGCVLFIEPSELFKKDYSRYLFPNT
ncbi:MAG: hypothetical protein VKJ02_10490 [Snowella sp.]|nr:hypothetical protein [Snowella sp.]